MAQHPSFDTFDPVGDPEGKGFLQLLKELARREPDEPISFEITDEDRELAEQLFRALAEPGTRALQEESGFLARNITGEFATRGLSGSTFEAQRAAIGATSLQNRLADVLSRAQAQSSQFLQRAPFLRGQLQLSQNQQLFQQIFSPLAAGGQIKGGIDVARIGGQAQIAGVEAGKEPMFLDYFNAAIGSIG